MTIDEAIKRLEIISEEPDEDWLDFEYAALKLGIEALHRVKEADHPRDYYGNRLLPGETKE